jgi:hypothetical protein
MTNKPDDDDPVIVDPLSDGKLHPMGSVAKLLGTSKSTIERLRAAGKLGPWFYMGTRPYMKGSDIKRFIDSLPGTPAAAE